MFINENKKNWVKILTLSLTTGLFLILTLPPFEIEFFIWFALVPLFFVLNKETDRKYVILGSALAGFVYILFLLWPLTSLNTWWVVNPNSNGFWWTHKESLLKIFIILASLYCGSTFFAIFAFFYRKFSVNNWQDLLFIPLFWTLLEFLREYFVFGFGWGELGYALNNNLAIVQIASIFKVYGLSFLIVAVNTAIYLWILDLRKKDRTTQGIVNKYSFLAIFLIITPLLFGFYDLNNKKESYKELKVVAIHSEIKSQDGANLESHNLYLEILEKALKNKPDLILMPENSLIWLEIDERNQIPTNNNSEIVRNIYQKILDLSEKNPKTAIFIGLKTSLENKNFNSVVAFENGKIVDIYHKRELLPLFENDFGFWGNKHIRPLNVPDKEKDILTTKKLKVSALICSEIDLNSLRISKSADIIINSGNDSVFDSPLVAKQNEIMAKIRAVENNKNLIRSMKGGESSIINQDGVILKKSNKENSVDFIETKTKIKIKIKN